MAKTLKIGTEFTGKVSSVLSRGKAFIVFFTGEDEPAVLAKRIAAEDGFIHRSQLVNQTVKFTPTAVTNGNQPGFIGSFDLPLANMSSNPMLARRQDKADTYAMAQLYAVQAAEEV